jgi:predicted  nucleic acid-binding Zn-ribbon protein
MGPSNVALVKLYQADQKLRQAQGRLDAVSKNVRIQERKLNDLTERLRLAQSKLKEQQAQSAGHDLDLKTREAKIDRLRTQQQNAHNNKEYQAFLIEINTEKVDKAKAEELLLKSMEAVEKLQAETVELSKNVEDETVKLKNMQAEIGERVKKLQAEVDILKPLRDAAYADASPKWRDEFERLAEKFEGEAMSALAKPDRRREEYACTACNMDLVTDIYNKLHSRDEIVFCPSCRRMLYIPDDLPIEMAVNLKTKKAEKKVESPAGHA